MSFILLVRLIPPPNLDKQQEKGAGRRGGVEGMKEGRKEGKQIEINRNVNRIFTTSIILCNPRQNKYPSPFSG